MLTASSLGTNIVIVRVGRAGAMVNFSVYEDVIRRTSAYMKNILDGPWRESQLRIINVPGFASQAFNVYYQWLLTGKLHTKNRVEQEDNGSSHLPFQKRQSAHKALLLELRPLKQALHLAHYLLDTDFTDTVCDALIQCTIELQAIGSWFSSIRGNLFCMELPEGLPARQLVTDLVAWTAPPTDYAKDNTLFKQAEPEFIIDVLQAVTARLGLDVKATSPLERWETSCKYHCHGERSLCYRVKLKG